jgi:hypothetical protein
MAARAPARCAARAVRRRAGRPRGRRGAARRADARVRRHSFSTAGAKMSVLLPERHDNIAS